MAIVLFSRHSSPRGRESRAITRVALPGRAEHPRGPLPAGPATTTFRLDRTGESHMRRVLAAAVLTLAASSLALGQAANQQTGQAQAAALELYHIHVVQAAP